MYALVEIKGKQYKAKQGSLLQIDSTDVVKGETLEIDSVLLIHDEEKVSVGTPYLDGVKVRAIVEDQIKGKKVVIQKFKKRKKYRRKFGHRQKYTLVRIEEIVGV